jgi:mevalonate kinase
LETRRLGDEEMRGSGQIEKENMDSNKKYYAKLMLVGEYGVIVGSEALTVPLKDFFAQLSKKESYTDPKKFNKSISGLKELFFYIHSLSKNSFHATPEFKEMGDLLDHGYYIKSNIPQGYGLGSSGAVSALVYDQFFKDSEKISLQEQRKDLAIIESFYHGKSSGVDAMSCYMATPLHFLPNGEIFRSNFNPSSLPGGYRFFLLDSGQVSNTAPLVKAFLNRMKSASYKILIDEDYIPLINKLIKSLSGSGTTDPALIFRAVSDFQWNHFRDMIPEKIEDQWIEGQVSNIYYLKLNGSGGGFMLGIAHEDSIEVVEGMLESKNVLWI